MPFPMPIQTAQLFYDGRCPLCAREMAFLRKHKRSGLTLVDIHSLLQLDEGERARLLRDLHLLKPDGSWLLGVDANVAAWSFTPFGFLFKPLRWRIWSRLVDAIYRRWADKRYCKNYACPVAQSPATNDEKVR